MNKTGLLRDTKLLMLEWHKWWSAEMSNETISEILIGNRFSVFDFHRLDEGVSWMMYAVR